jgi:hypothetical protein
VTDLHEFEARLRHDIGRAAQAVTPPPGALERAIDTARARGDMSRASRWPVRRWILPLPAAATVLIVVSAVLLLVHTTQHVAPVGPSVSPIPSATTAPTTPSTAPTTPSTAPTTPSTAPTTPTAPLSEPRTTPATVRVVVRPVYADGTPAAGYAVLAEAHTHGFGCFGEPSPVAVDPDIHFCGSNGDNTNACWESSHNTVLCLRDATKKVLLRIPVSTPVGSVKPIQHVEATQHPVPQLITLADGSTCMMRNGGAANSPPQHPSWILYYFCPHDTAVYGPTSDDGIDETVTPWTVVIFPISGAEQGHNRPVHTAYFVGTAH